MRSPLFLLLCLLALVACGQKGPLVLPDDATPKPPVVAPNTQAQP